MVEDRLCERIVCERVVCERQCVKELCVKEFCVNGCVWKNCVCERLCVEELCVEVCMCSSLCVKEMCVTKLHVKELRVEVCVKELCVWESVSACVWNIWTDVKLLLFCIVSRCRGRQHFTGTVSNEATSEMGYPAWPAGRTCNPIISFSLTWHGAKPRTPIPDVSVHALHVCRNLVFIHLEISTFAAILRFLLAPVHILIWGLFEQVSDRGPVCRNSFLLITYVTYTFEEIYLGSIILFNCTLWDSVPDGSLQWSSPVLVWFPRWLRHGAMDTVEGTHLGEWGQTDLWIYTF